MRVEVEAMVELEAGRTLGEILAEAGLHDALRDAHTRQVDRLSRRFFESEPFAQWLDGLLP